MVSSRRTTSAQLALDSVTAVECLAEARERVIAYEEPRLFSYEVLSGVPVRKQVGTVTLTDQPLTNPGFTGYGSFSSSGPHSWALSFAID